jgi:membrane associated rhomboid family serine protease
MSDQPHQGPVNPLPPVIVALFFLIFGIEITFFLGEKGIIGGPAAVGWRLAALEEYGFSPKIFWWMIENGVYPPEHLKRFLSYAFVHANFTHTLFVGVFLLALGKMVGEAFGAVATLIIFVLSAICGAVIYGLVAGGEAWLVGGYPAVYGLIGAFTYILWLRLGQMGEAQVRAFSLIGFLLGIQLIFGLLFSGPPDWVGDIGGFATGFLVSFVVSPGGWSKLLDKLRQR